MSRMREELAVGGAISAAVALAGGVLFFRVAAPRLGLATAIAAVIFLYGLLVSYVYADAKRRGMRAGPWALVAALVPNALGFLAYFLLREPVLRPCPACGTEARRDLAFCPRCGTTLTRVCPSCRRPLEPAWSHCAHCGNRLDEGLAEAAR